MAGGPFWCMNWWRNGGGFVLVHIVKWALFVGLSWNKQWKGAMILIMKWKGGFIHAYLLKNFITVWRESRHYFWLSNPCPAQIVHHLASVPVYLITRKYFSVLMPFHPLCLPFIFWDVLIWSVCTKTTPQPCTNTTPLTFPVPKQTPCPCTKTTPHSKPKSCTKTTATRAKKLHI